MSTRRTAKVAEAIRQVVSSAILFELRDPRVKNVTVLSAEVAPDLKTAKVYVSVMGDEKMTRRSLQGLNSSRGWLQSKIADELQLRYTPVITFVIDKGVKNSLAVAEILRQIQREHPERQEQEDDEDDEDDDGLDDEKDDLSDEE